jgi:hypothetical protein
MTSVRPVQGYLRPRSSAPERGNSGRSSSGLSCRRRRQIPKPTAPRNGR